MIEASGEAASGDDYPRATEPTAGREELASRDARVIGLAQSFSDRHRRGERPTIDEYAARHPDLAAEIRKLFPVLCALEEVGPAIPEPVPASDRELGPLMRLGEYRIIRELGRGGMGVVYEAEQETLRRRVAIKALLFQGFQDRHQLERFRVEAQAAARLHHTNIVPVFGVGEDRGVHYYVMQFIRGQTLAEILQEVRRLRAAGRGAAGAGLREGASAADMARTLFEDDGHAPPEPPPAGAPPASPAPAAGTHRSDSTSSIARDPRGIYCRSVARLALQVAEGLAYAHNEHVLHRDIKPSNLLLDMKGTVWITDFGLAKVHDSVELTAAGSLVGTLRYMAPERFRGTGDARSDVYSLGVTLYELLTLQPAFTACDRADLLREVAACSPPPPRRLDPSIPRDLETVVLKAIAREPKDRYESAAALAADLGRFLNHEPVSARRSGAVERLWRWCQRQPALAALTGVITLLLVALAAGGLVSAARVRVERDRTFERLVESKRAEARAWQLSHKTGARLRSLAALREAATPATAAEVRNEVIGSLALVDLEKVTSRDVSLWTYVAPDLERLAVQSADGVIEVFEGIGGREPIARLHGTERRLDCAWLSPGGLYLAVCGKGPRWVVWDLHRGAALFECAFPWEAAAAAFDASASRFAHVDRDGSVVIRDLPGGGVVRRLEDIETLEPSWLSFDPGGLRLAAAGCGMNANTVVVLELAAGRVLSRLFHPHDALMAAWDPGGRRLAVGCGDYRVYVWEAESAQCLHRLEGHFAEVVGVAFDGTGALLASTGWDHRTLFWDSETGELLIEATGNLVGFASDGRRLGLRQGYERLEEWRVVGNDALSVLPAPLAGKGPRDLDVSPDGRWLAAACSEQGLRVWSADPPGGVHHLNAGTLHSLCFQADGSALWTGGSEGLHRWPLRAVAGADDWALGPPVNVLKGMTRSLSLTRDARRAAMIGDTGIVIRDLEAGGAVLRSFDHPQVDSCDLSPSGRWLVSGPFHGVDVRVWEVAAGTVVRAFAEGSAVARFSPDERWLAMSGTHLTVVETGTWKERLKVAREGAGNLGGPLAFSRDGDYLAFARSRSLLSLVRMADGMEAARFDPRGWSLPLDALAFGPDRDLIFASSQHRIQVWDLRLIRRELSGLGLDWAPGEPIPGPRRTGAPKLLVDSGGLPAGQRDFFELQQEAGKLIDVLTQRLDLDPSPEAFSARAAVHERQGDLNFALADLDRVLAASPADRAALVRRAALLERLGRGQQALEDCDRALAACGQAAREVSPGHAAACETCHEVLRVQARMLRSLGKEFRGKAWHAWKELLAIDGDDREACARLVSLWIVTRCAPDPRDRAGEMPADRSLALECAERNHAAEPENELYGEYLGAVLYHQGDLEKARPLLEKLCRVKDGGSLAHIYLALIEHHEGKPAEARTRFDQASAAGRSSIEEGSAERECFEKVVNFAAGVLKAPPAEK